MALFPELAARSPEELARAFDTGPTSADTVPEEEVPLWLDEVALALAENGEPGLNALLQRVASADEQHLGAIFLAVSSVKGNVRRKYQRQLQQLLLSFLDDPRPDVVAGAVDGLTILGAKDVGDRVLPLLDHPSPYVVGSALRYLARHHPEEARPALLRALQAADPIVRQNAVDELDEMSCVEALPQLRPLLNDEDEDVRLAARTAVSNLEDLLTEGKGP
jgi:hypothetical protein